MNNEHRSPLPQTFDVWAHLAAMPTPFEHAWQRFGTSPARTGIFMASSNDFVKSNCCVLCDDRHHFRSLREKYEHLRSKKHLFDYIICFGRVRKDAVAQAWRRVIRKE